MLRSERLADNTSSVAVLRTDCTRSRRQPKRQPSRQPSNLIDITVVNLARDYGTDRCQHGVLRKKASYNPKARYTLTAFTGRVHGCKQASFDHP